MYREEIPHFRELSESEKESVNDCFTTYLFYETINKRGDREFTCSHCGKTFLIPNVCRLTTDDIYVLQRVRHNEEYHCPKCKIRAVIKNKGSAKSCKNLDEEQRVCVIQTRGENKVYIQCFEATKSYSKGGYYPRIEYNCVAKYYLTPSQQKKYKYHWYLGWGEYNVISEPFVPRNAMGYPVDNSYTLIGTNRLENTFLKYNMLAEYANRRADYLLNACSDLYKAEIKMVKYLVSFAKYSQIEMLQKLGHYDVVENLIEAGIKSGPFVDWKAKTIYDFFKMTKGEYKEFKALGGTIDILKTRKVLRKTMPNPSWKTISRYNQECGGAWYIESAIKMLQDFSLPVRQGLEYLIKQKNKKGLKSFPRVTTEYTDYYRMARELNYDLANPVVFFPKDLEEAHDNANRNHQVLLEQRRIADEQRLLSGYKSIKKKYKKQYEFTDGVFSIIIPNDISEIIREGKLQQHCVGGYAHRHIEGKLAICFLRKCSALDKPLYTIEMHDTRLTQVQGKGNRTPLTPKAEAFFNLWLNWVKNGSKRNKDGTPKIIAVAAAKTA